MKIIKGVGTIAFMILPFLVAILLIRPFEDVLYGGDDWGQVWTVKHFLDTGLLKNCYAMKVLAIPQSLSGSLVSYWFGFNFHNLNLLTVIISIIGIVAIYWMMRELGIAKMNAVFVGIFVSITPVYIGFGISFMSEMYYTVFMVVSIAAYIRGLRLNKIVFILLGGVLATLAFLQRQIGFSLFVSFALVVLFIYKKEYRDLWPIIRVLIAGISIPFFVFLLYILFPDLFAGTTSARSHVLNISWIVSNALNLKKDILHIFQIWNYTVIWLLPLLILIWWGNRKELFGIFKRQFRIGIIIGVIYLIGPSFILLMGKRHLVPGEFFQVCYVWPNLFIVKGAFVWNVLTYLCAIPTAILTALAFHYIKKDKHLILHRIDWPYMFIILILIIQILFTTIYDSFFNNHIMPLLPLFAALFVKLTTFHFSQKISGLFLGLILIGAMIISITIVESQVKYTEVNWREANSLVASGVNSRKIYAHPSWYVWNNYDEFSKRDKSFFEFIRGQSCYIVTEVPEKELPNEFGKIHSIYSVYYNTIMRQKKMYVHFYNSLDSALKKNGLLGND